MELNRRSVLKTGGAVALASSVGPWPIARAADTLTVAAYGGEFEEIFRRTVIEPFEKKFSVRVIYDNSSSQTQMYAKMRAGRGTAPFDIAAEMAAGQVILGAKEKLLQEITEREVPNLKYVWDSSRKLIPPYGIVQNYQYLALIWNKNKIKQPTSWLDYWQAQKVYGEEIKGRVLSHGMSNYELAWLEALSRPGRRHLGCRSSLHGEPAGLDRALLERAIGLLHEARPADRNDGPQGGHDLPRHHIRRADRVEEQAARLRIHELPARPGDPA